MIINEGIFTHNILDQADKLQQTTSQLGDFISDLRHMLFIHFFKRFECMASMCTTPKSTLMADTAATSPAINSQLLLMCRASVIIEAVKYKKSLFDHFLNNRQNNYLSLKFSLWHTELLCCMVSICCVTSSTQRQLTNS